MTRPFFTEDPRLLVEKGGFVQGLEAVMMGFNKHEGLLYIGAPVYKDRGKFEFLKYERCDSSKRLDTAHELLCIDDCRKNWNKCISNNLLGKFSEDVTDEESQLVREAMEMYFGIAKDGFEGNQITREQLDLLVALSTDAHFAQGIDLAVR